MSIRRFVRPALLALLVLVVGVVAYVGWPSAEWQPYQYGRAGRTKLPRMTMLNHQRVMGEVLGTPALPVRSIGILIYDGVSTIEAVGAMVTLSELMNVTVHYVATEAAAVETDLARLVAHKATREVDALDALVVPGGSPEAVAAVLADAGLMRWIAATDRTTTLTAGIGSGTVLLARAGVLGGRTIAFDWPAAEANTAALGARHREARYTHDGKYWTSVGGTAALDLGLALVEAIGGRANLQGAMLDLEYDPKAPFDGGSAATTPPAIVAALAAESADLEGLTLRAASTRASASAAQGAAPSPPLRVGILVYDGFFTLDALGPLAVLSNLRNADVQLLRAGAADTVQSGRTQLLVPRVATSVDALDVLVVPGGSTGTWAMTEDSAVLAWIRRIDERSRYTTSVCTGAWVLGAAGLLRGRDATTNWYRAGQMLERYGARFTPERYVRDGKYWTSAGVSAGIDLSLALLADVDGEDAARAAMLRLRYRPEPPAPGGAPEKTDDRVLDMMQQMYDFLMVPLIRRTE
jgi:transcriptional regulator GlxA family with amidase domain